MKKLIQNCIKSRETAPYTAFLPEFLAVFAAVLVRFFSYGFTYYPILDDYTQYFNYANSTDFAALIAREGYLASRPLAGLGDLFFWSRFRGNLAFALLLLSLLWALSAVLFRRVLSRYFPCGWVFLAVYALLPLNFEGTYWLSASTRIVCGMFFLSLSLTLFDRILRLPLLPLRGSLRVAAFALCLCLSYCFYEQILVLSLTAVLLFSLIGGLQKNRKSLFGLLSFGAAGGYFAFTAAHHTGTLAARMEVILPEQGYYFDTFLPQLLTQLRRVFFSGNFFTLFRGVSRGVRIIFTDHLFLSALLMVAVSVFAFLLSRRMTSSGPTTLRHRYLYGVVCAVLLMLAPITPYFIINHSWFSFRNAVPSLLGAAMLCDLTVHGLFGLMLHRRETLRRTMCGVLAAGLCLFFEIASISELHDYRAASMRDVRAAEAIFTYLDTHPDVGVEKRLGIFALNAADAEAQNYLFHEHVCGAVENYGMLQNMLVALGADAASLPEVFPLDTAGTNTNRDTAVDAEGYPIFYLAWNAPLKRPDAFDVLLWYEEESGTLTEVTAQKEENRWTIVSSEGIVFAYITETGDSTAHIETLQ